MRDILAALTLVGFLIALGMSWRETALCDHFPKHGQCGTDTHCMCMHGGNGDPEPMLQAETD